MDYTALMQGLASALGIPDLNAGDGACALDVGGTTVGLVSEGDALSVVADIGTRPPHASGACEGAMLKANYLFRGTEGATFCQNPETGGYAVMQWFACSDLDTDRLVAHIGRIVSMAEKWKAVVAGYGPAEETSAAPAAETAPLDPPADGFLQV